MKQLLILDAIVGTVFVLSMVWAEWLRKSNTGQVDQIEYYRIASVKTKNGVWVHLLQGGKDAKLREIDTCPECGSTNVANEDDTDAVTCHDCSYQWDEEA